MNYLTALIIAAAPGIAFTAASVYTAHPNPSTADKGCHIICPSCGERDLRFTMSEAVQGVLTAAGMAERLAQQPVMVRGTLA